MNPIESSTDSFLLETGTLVCPRCQSRLVAGTGVLPSLRKLTTLTVHESGNVGATNAGEALQCEECLLPVSFSLVDDRIGLSTPYHHLLIERWGARRYTLWALAQNNGLISYQQQPAASCSVEGREDVAGFARYIGARRGNRRIEAMLDIGCGPLPRPGYLSELSGIETMVGLDPFPSSWEGIFVQGISEFIPLKENSVDMVTAATALDHTFDLDSSLAEFARVLRPGGDLLVWDHPVRSWHQVLYNRRADWVDYVKLRRRARLYDDGTVLEIPRGMADPFHLKRSQRRSWPRRLVASLRAAGFQLQDSRPAQGFSHYVCTTSITPR